MSALLLSLAGNLAAGPAAGAALAGGRGVAIDPLRILLALGIALVCAWLAALLMARVRRGNGLPPGLSGGRRKGDLIVQETRRVGPGADVCLVEWDKKQYLIGVTATAMNVLDTRDLLPHRPEAEDPAENDA